ncbi:hypothetical protein KKC44_00700, partial [Patescibacteria group bacterium]|nr:hypothetical protein [Patescibacteria group bacterium]
LKNGKFQLMKYYNHHKLDNAHFIFVNANVHNACHCGEAGSSHKMLIRKYQAPNRLHREDEWQARSAVACGLWPTVRR